MNGWTPGGRSPGRVPAGAEAGARRATAARSSAACPGVVAHDEHEPPFEVHLEPPHVALGHAPPLGGLPGGGGAGFGGFAHFPPLTSLPPLVMSLTVLR